MEWKEAGGEWGAMRCKSEEGKGTDVRGHGGKVEEIAFILRAGSLWKVLAGASNVYISILSEGRRMIWKRQEVMGLTRSGFLGGVFSICLQR